MIKLILKITFISLFIFSIGCVNNFHTLNKKSNVTLENIINVDYIQFQDNNLEEKLRTVLNKKNKKSLLLNEMESNSLIAWWNFDNINSNYINNNNELINDGYVIGNPVILNSNKNLSNIIKLDGKDDYILVKDKNKLNLGINNITISAFIKIDDITKQGTQCIISKAGNSIEPGYSFDYNFEVKPNGKVVNNLSFTLTNGNYFINDAHTQIAESTTAITPISKNLNLYDNKWHNITVSVNRKTGVSFYVDNKLINNYYSKSYAKFENTFVANNSNVKIGSKWENKFNFEGMIGDIKIYKNSLNKSTLVSLNNFNDNYYITNEEFHSVKTLNLENSNISNLAGLENFINLEEVNLSNNLLDENSNIDKLFYLANIKKLVIKNNNIKNLRIFIENLASKRKNNFKI